MDHGAPVLCLLAAALACACSSGEAPDPVGRPLTLREVAGGLSRDEEPAPATRVRVPPASDPEDPEVPDGWLVQAPERGRTPAGGLRAFGGRAQSVSVPGPFEPRTFNRLRVRVSSVEGEGRLYVQLARRDRPTLAAATRSADLRPSDEEQVLTFDFPENAARTGTFDSLILTRRGKPGGFELRGIELSRLPLSGFLPSAERGAELVRLDDQSRRAVGLAAGRDLEVDFVVPPRSRLNVTFCVPPELALPDSRLRLRVVLEGDGPVHEESELEVPVRGTRQASWRTEEIDLAGMEGRTLSARFALLGAERGEVCALAEPFLTVTGPRPPTVLLITSDTHRGDHLGSAARPAPVRTPALDELARRGVLFEQCFSSANVTNPSHVALMTATHPRDTAVLDNFTPLGREATTLAEAFRSEGWATFAVVSALHLSDQGSGLGQGFERMHVYDGVSTEARHSISVLESWLPDAEGRALFVWLHVFDAHTPYRPPEEFEALYREPDADDDATTLARYRGEVTYLDRELGRLLEGPRFGDAIVAFTADHGESLGEHGITWAHAGLYPQTLHVPLVLSWPGAPAGTRVSRRVSHLGLGRTLLDLAGAETAEFPGESLLLELDATHGEVEPMFALAAGATSASVTDGRWHLIVHLRDHFLSDELKATGRRAERHATEFYDLDADPECRRDLSGDEEVAPELRARRARLVQWLSGERSVSWSTGSPTDARVLKRLAQLGYAERGAEGGEPVLDPACGCKHCRRHRRSPSEGF